VVTVVVLLAPERKVPDAPASEPSLKGEPPLRVNRVTVEVPRSKALVELPVFP
jgi:hypothetical protein